MTDFDTPINEGALVLSMEEWKAGKRAALDLDITFDPQKHPRDLRGHFRDTVAGLKPGRHVALRSNGASVIRRPAGEKGASEFKVVSAGGEVLGEHNDPQHAANRALDHKAKPADMSHLLPKGSSLDKKPNPFVPEGFGLRHQGLKEGDEIAINGWGIGKLKGTTPTGQPIVEIAVSQRGGAKVISRADHWGAIEPFDRSKSPHALENPVDMVRRQNGEKQTIPTRAPGSHGVADDQVDPSRESGSSTLRNGYSIRHEPQMHTLQKDGKDVFGSSKLGDVTEHYHEQTHQAEHHFGTDAPMLHSILSNHADNNPDIEAITRKLGQHGGGEPLVKDEWGKIQHIVEGEHQTAKYQSDVGLTPDGEPVHPSRAGEYESAINRIAQKLKPLAAKN